MVWYHRNRKKAPKTTIFSGNFTRVLDGIGRVLDGFSSGVHRNIMQKGHIWRFFD